MAILTRSEILEEIKNERVKFSPEIDSHQLQAHSIDLRLGFTFMVPKSWQMKPEGRVPLHLDFYDPDRPDHFDIVELEKGQFFDLLPGEYVLVSTLETITIPDDVMAVMYPRSSTNRKGISVDLTGIVDSGYHGQLVIPIRNNTTSQVVRTYPGERFCQIVLQRLSGSVKTRKSRYHQKDVIDGVKIDSLQHEKEEIELIKTGDIAKLKETRKIEELSKD